MIIFSDIINGDSVESLWVVYNVWCLMQYVRVLDFSEDVRSKVVDFGNFGFNSGGVELCRLLFKVMVLIMFGLMLQSRKYY